MYIANEEWIPSIIFLCYCDTKLCLCVYSYMCTCQSVIMPKKFFYYVTTHVYIIFSAITHMYLLPNYIYVNVMI